MIKTIKKAYKNTQKRGSKNMRNKALFGPFIMRK
jgi:hypothetical protein